MKKLIVLFFVFFLVSCSKSPVDLSGSWLGVVSKEDVYEKFSMIFDISYQDSAYMVVLHNPDDRSLNNETDIYVEGDSIKLFSGNKISFQGVIKSEKLLEGTYIQKGVEQEARFVKQKDRIVFNRPQTPTFSKSSYNESVYLVNECDENNHELCGIFSRPWGNEKIPAVVLIAGSGPLDKDETMAGHKPFWVIADYLVKNSIAVLRYDKRGIGCSFGDHYEATSLDFAEDAMVAVEWLREREDIDKSKIGLIGHSEGGMISFMLAAKDKELGFIIPMGAPGVSGKEIREAQQNSLYTYVDSVKDKDLRLIESIEELLDSIPSETMEVNTDSYIEQIMSVNGYEKESEREKVISYFWAIKHPWRIFFSNYDPYENIKNTSCPVFAINGEKDLQVLAEQNISAIDSLLKLGGNLNYETKIYPGLNHLFQHCQTGKMSEYAWLEETFSEEVLSDIVEWIGELE